MEQETKISELTELPGNLSPDAILAIVQGGVSYHATGEQVSNMVLGNISVIENTSTGQWNARIPVGASGGIQIDYNPQGVATYSNAGRLSIATTDSENKYLRNFASSVRAILVGLPDAGTNFQGSLSPVTHNFQWTSLNAQDGANGHLYRAGGPTFSAGDGITNLTFLAVGRY